MATYYIDPTGVDDAGRDGSISQPWQKLSYAASQVAEGDHTIYVKAGTYPVDSDQAYIRVGVKIDGAGATSYLKTDYNPGGSYSGWMHFYSTTLTDGNQSVKNVRIGGENLAGNCAINIINRNNIEISNVEIFDFAARGINIRHDGGDTTFATGIVIHNCNIYNCADRTVTTSCGLIVNKGADGTDIHDNTLTQTGRAEGHNGNIYTSWGNYEKNTKFYRNVCTKPDHDGVQSGEAGWNFHLETGHCLGGVEVYENTFLGGTAIDIAGGDHYKGTSNFSYWIHHNTHTLTSQLTYVPSVQRAIFVDLERTCEHVIVEYNRTDKVTEGVAVNLTEAGSHIIGFRFRYNICTNLGYVPSVTSPWRGGVQLGTNNATGYVSDCEIDNNVLIGNGIISGVGLYAYTGSTVSDIKIRNNIIQGVVSWGWLVFRNTGGAYENIYAWNNIIYNCVTDDTPYYEGGVSVTNYDPQDNIVSNPLFVGGSPYDFSLQSTSPAIDAGIDVGLISDFIGTLVPYGSAPDIGAYEWFEVVYDFTNITLVNTPACYNAVDNSIISRWVATECPINFTLLRRDWYVINSSDVGGFLAVSVYGSFTGNDNDVISVYDLTTNSMYTGTITDKSGDPILITDIPYVAGMDIKYLNDHTLYAGYYFEGRLTINGVVESLTVIASPDSFGYADLDVSGILRIKTSIGKVTNYLSLIQKDTNKSGQFTLEYRGCWYGSNEAWISEGSQTSPASEVVWYYAECVRSEEQGCNLAEYVPTDQNDAPFLNQFDTPVYWYGLPFDLSFILPERPELSPTSDIIVTMKVYNSANVQMGADIVQTIDVDSLEGYVNSLNIDSTLISAGAAYFTVEIFSM